jgi:eukaryotic-like serine/threonine-protein kinase
LQGQAAGHASRYTLGECLRRTGSGTVHAAFDSQLSREVVLKTVYADGDTARRQAREAALLAGARAAARLNHPYIVTLHDAGLCERGVFIATEFVCGCDLRSRLADRWRPEPVPAARIAARIAQALGHAHGAGVVHGRLEPSNIFMIGRTQLKVLNFGLAGAIAGLEAMPSEPTDGDQACGLAGCVAPERLLGEPIHTRGDIYGLGLVMYEMLAGRSAFSGDSPDELRHAVLHDDIPAVHALNPAVPIALSNVVTCAMARNPALRYQSAQQMLDALRLYLSDAAGAAAQAARSPSRVQLAVALLAVVAASGLGVVALRSLPTPAPRPVQASAPVAKTSAPVGPASAPSAPTPAISPAASAVEAIAPAAGLAASKAGGAAPNIAAAASASAPSSGHTSSAAPPTPSKRPMQRAAITPPKARPPVTAARPLELERSPVDAGNERAPSLATPATPAMPPPPAPTASAATSAATPKGRGAINFAVEPRGQVEVNGAPIGPTPPMLRLTLPNGSYTITIRNEGFPPYSTNVVVSDDKPVTINHRFGP